MITLATMPDRLKLFERTDNIEGAKRLQKQGEKYVCLYDGHLCGYGSSKHSLQNATETGLESKMEYLTIRQFLNRWAAIGSLATAVLLSSCAPTVRTYRVTFADGSVEYYNLDYKPKKGATSIECEGETVLGVVKIEKY